MRERMVVCGGLQAPRGSPTDTLKLDVNASAGSSRKVNLHLGDLFPADGRQYSRCPDRYAGNSRLRLLRRPVYKTRHRTHDEHGRRLAPQVPVQDSCPVPRRVGQGQRS